MLSHRENGSLRCRYIEAGGDAGYEYRYKELNIPVSELALICVNLYSLLREVSDPVRRRYARRYTAEEMQRRDSIAENRIAPLIETARACGMPVVYSADSSPNIAISKSALGQVYVKHLNIDPETDFREAENEAHEYLIDTGASGYSSLIAPQSGDYYVRKFTYSGFHGTWMDRLLRNVGVKAVLLCGFDTECDVLCTGLDSTALGYKTIVIRDAVATACSADYSETMSLNDRWVLHFEEGIGFSVDSTALSEYLSHERS